MISCISLRGGYERPRYEPTGAASPWELLNAEKFNFPHGSRFVLDDLRVKGGLGFFPRGWVEDGMLFRCDDGSYLWRSGHRIMRSETPPEWWTC